MGCKSSKKKEKERKKTAIDHIIEYYKAFKKDAEKEFREFWDNLTDEFPKSTFDIMKFCKKVLTVLDDNYEQGNFFDDIEGFGIGDFIVLFKFFLELND